MKKFMLSAVFVMAFSSGFAIGNVKTFQSLPCTNQYVKDYQALKSAGFSDRTAEAIADADFNDCLDRTYGTE